MLELGHPILAARSHCTGGDRAPVHPQSSLSPALADLGRTPPWDPRRNAPSHREADPQNRPRQGDGTRHFSAGRPGGNISVQRWGLGVVCIWGPDGEGGKATLIGDGAEGSFRSTYDPPLAQPAWQPGKFDSGFPRKPNWGWGGGSSGPQEVLIQRHRPPRWSFIANPRSTSVPPTSPSWSADRRHQGSGTSPGLSLSPQQNAQPLLSQLWDLWGEVAVSFLPSPEPRVHRLGFTSAWSILSLKPLQPLQARVLLSDEGGSPAKMWGACPLSAYPTGKGLLRGTQGHPVFSFRLGRGPPLGHTHLVRKG